MGENSVNLNDTEVLFLSLKPRLHECTTIDIEGMGTKQKSALPLKVQHLLALARMENDGADTKS